MTDWISVEHQQVPKDRSIFAFIKSIEDDTWIIWFEEDINEWHGMRLFPCADYWKKIDPKTITHWAELPKPPVEADS